MRWRHRGDLGKHSLMEKLMKEFLPPIEQGRISWRCAMILSMM